MHLLGSWVRLGIRIGGPTRLLTWRRAHRAAGSTICKSSFDSRQAPPHFRGGAEVGSLHLKSPAVKCPSHSYAITRTCFSTTSSALRACFFMSSVYLLTCSMSTCTLAVSASSPLSSICAGGFCFLVVLCSLRDSTRCQRADHLIYRRIIERAS